MQESPDFDEADEHRQQYWQADGELDHTLAPMTSALRLISSHRITK
jgi:hypothetical protein